MSLARRLGILAVTLVAAAGAAAAAEPAHEHEHVHGAEAPAPLPGVARPWAAQKASGLFARQPDGPR